MALAPGQQRLLVGVCVQCVASMSAFGQVSDSLVRESGDSLRVRFVDVDVRTALQSLSRFIDVPLSFGTIPPTRVTLETPRPIARSQVLAIMRGLAEAQGLEISLDTLAGMYRVRAAAPQLPIRPPVAMARPGAVPPRSDGSAELFVLRLRHARAADVAAGVNALYGRATAMGELGSDARSRAMTLEDGLRQSTVPPPQTADARGPAEARPATGRQAVGFAGDVNLVPDNRTNSLLIRSTRADYELIVRAVQELDVRPLQVLIEVLIVEVRRDRALAFGLETGIQPTRLPGRSGGQIEGGVSSGSAGDMIVRLLGFTAGTTQLNATLRAAASSGDVHIVSRPIVIAANNEVAEIVVGSQRPFIQVQRSLPTEAPSRDQVVQYRDVGTRLSVRPTISADGYVMLAVTQEVNAATTETAFDAPVISTRSVQTQLLIKDQATVVLGGLIDRQRDNTRRGIPLLSRIPFLGGLFGRVDRRSTETELFMFLTPRVISDDKDAQNITEPLQKRANAPGRPK